MVQKGEILIYRSKQGNTKIDARLVNESLWLTQKLIAVLFEVDVRTINEHLQNIFKSKELDADSVIRKFRITASDVKNYLNRILINTSKSSWEA